MAGQPRKRAVAVELQRRAIEMFGADGTILDYAEDYVSSGGSIAGLADELQTQLSVGVITREMVRRVIYVSDEQNAEERLVRARARGAHGLAEQAVVIADSAVEAEIGLARLKISSRQWLAERWNPAELGSKQGTTVNVSIAALHLAALQTPAVVPIAIANAIAEEAEILSIEESTT